MFVILLLLSRVTIQEATPANQFNINNYYPDYLSDNTVKFVRPKPTKKGPILFPNDAPPPPPTPLIVTSRPLSESIARSELNPNNSLAAQSQLNQVSYRPDYLARVKDYAPYTVSPAPVSSLYGVNPTQVAFTNTESAGTQRDTFYIDYEKKLMEIIHRSKHEIKEKHLWDHPIQRRRIEQARSLRPLYEVTEREHLRPVHKILQKPTHHYKYQTHSPDSYFDTNDSGERHGKDYNKGDNYAFSYTVKDHKTGDDFSHSQQSTGSATNGEYRVRLPDGRMQIVSYTADENGYKADVRYDDHHKNDNSIDTSKENGFRPHPIHKPKPENNFEHNFNDRDFSVNRDYIDRRYKIDSQYELDETSLAPRPTVDTHDAKHFEHNDFLDIKDDYNGKSHSLTDNNDDYLDRVKEKDIDDNYKLERARDNDYYHNDDVASHELVDYSSDIEQAYQPHKSKFSSFNQDKPKTKVTPTYDELKDLFVTNVYRRLQNNRAAISTPIPSYDVTTERVVVIAPKSSKLYTNIHTSSPGTPLPLVYPTPQPSFVSTPRSYLVSTIANLKSQISLLKKPVLSNQYIDKINKYLSYK